MNIVSSSRMKEIDRLAIEEWGFGDLLLMENAGIRILEKAEELYMPEDELPVVCVAGGGNNGGDALVIARQVFSRRKNPVSILIVKNEGSPSYNFHLNICRNLGITILKYPEDDINKAVGQAGLIFDGLSGTGINGALREPLPGLIESLNKSDAKKIAIDVPSGIGDSFRKGYPAIQADCTLTVGLPLRCLYLPEARSFCGNIHTVRIGFPEQLKNQRGTEADGIDCELITDDYISRLMPELKPHDYKNSRGHLAVFAGSKGTSGAAVLCSSAALRTSAGLVSLFTDEEIYTAAASSLASVMVKSIGKNGKQKLPDLSTYTASAVGPGWGISNRNEMLKTILEGSRGILDADGLNVLSEMIKSGYSPNLGRNWVLTPHPGEFRRLFEDLDWKSNPYSAAVKAAERLNCVIMLKGHVSYIAEPGGRCAVLDGCYPRLGTGGSGDVLAGIIGGYAASGLDVFDAAVLGAAVHLRAGKRCGSGREWFSSEDLLSYL